VRLIGIYVMSLISVLLAVASVWLVISGRNLPGLLGRGFTKGDNQRLKRAPRVYFRALGLFVGAAALDGFFFAWVISLLPRPSIAMLEMAAAVIVVRAGARGIAIRPALPAFLEAFRRSGCPPSPTDGVGRRSAT